MQAAQPPLRSYGELARALLSHPAWPEEARTKARSLEALLGKLDRDAELEWLAERPTVQLALSELVQCSPEEIRAHVRRAREERAESSQLLRFEEAPFARPVELAREALCPGIPPEVLEPSRWERMWWRTESGAGQEWVGRWLTVRGLARALTAREWIRNRSEETEASGSQARWVVFEDADLDDEDLRAALATRVEHARAPVCVVGPAALGLGERGFHSIESPAPARYADALVDWLAERLPGDGRFEAATAKKWLRATLLGSPGLGLSELLGWCGALDALGPTETRGRSPLDVARRFVLGRVRRLEQRDAADLAWLRRSGFEALRGLVRSLLTDSDAPWSVARPFEDWLELVAHEHQRDPDLDWVRVSLLDGDLPFQKRELERAAKRLPPGGFRIVRGLRAAELLLEEDDGLRLHPAWLGRFLVRESAQQIARGAAGDLGEALLRPHAAPSVAAALEARFRAGDLGAVEDVLDLEHDAEPSEVAALEAVATAAGLVLLDGQELPADQIEELWNEVCRLQLSWPDRVPEPRVLHPRAEVGSLLHPGTWLIGVMALAENVPRGRGASHPVLRPWHVEAASADLARVYERLHEILQSAPGLAPWAYSLVDRLRQAVGSPADTPHPLERPSILLEEAALGVVAPASWAGLEVLPGALSALPKLARERGLPWVSFIEALWLAWADQPDEAALGWLHPSCASSAGFRAPLPPRALDLLLERGIAPPLADLPDESWSIVFAPSRALPPHLELAVWSALPETRFAVAVARGAPRTREARRAVWSRLPELVTEHVKAQLAAASFECLLWLDGAPEALTEELATLLETVPRDRLQDESALLLRRWAHQAVGLRAPGWRRAHTLLAEFERELRRAAL
jgi:hypothetical protein